MLFAIWNTEKEQYLCWENSSIGYTDDFKQARQFQEKAQVTGFWNGQLVTFCTNNCCMISEFQIRRYQKEDRLDYEVMNPSAISATDTSVVIYNHKTGQYMCNGNGLIWDPDKTTARIFKSITYARNCIRTNLKAIQDRKVDLGELYFRDAMFLDILEPVLKKNDGPSEAKPFYIRNKATACYLSDVPGSKVVSIVWTHVQKAALLFSTADEAKKFTQNNKKKLTASGTQMQDICIVNSGTEEETTIIVSKQAVQMPEYDLDWDALTGILAALPQTLAPILTVKEQIKNALNYCEQKLRLEDMETIDILHKIEFSSPNVVGGYRLYKTLHECRCRRREMKDAIELLELISTSGLLEAARQFSDQYNAYQRKLETRTYHPRVRADLFMVSTD